MEDILIIICISLIGILWWAIYCIFKWCQDTIIHHYEDSIFNTWEYFRHDWRRKYYDGDPAKGRKKFLGLVIPPVFFDGWHLFDVLRNLAAYTGIYLVGGIAAGHLSWWTYILFGLLAAAAVMVSEKLFYRRLLINSESKDNLNR